MLKISDILYSVEMLTLYEFMCHHAQEVHYNFSILYLTQLTIFTSFCSVNHDGIHVLRVRHCYSATIRPQKRMAFSPVCFNVCFSWCVVLS